MPWAMEMIQFIAQVCHEANRAYCQAIGDLSQPPWADAPGWQKESAINGVYFHFGALDRGEYPNPSQSHNNWLKEKLAEGWKYGPVKDPTLKEHPCCIPYDQLPKEQKAKDFIFSAIVKTFWQANGNTLSRIKVTRL